METDKPKDKKTSDLTLRDIPDVPLKDMWGWWKKLIALGVTFYIIVGILVILFILLILYLIFLPFISAFL